MKTNNGNNILAETFDDVLTRHIERRSFIKSAVAALPMLFIDTNNTQALAESEAIKQSKLSFAPISLSSEDRVTVPNGYSTKVLIRWGDPIIPGAVNFDINTQTAQSQNGQFGYNCDFVGFFPLPDFHSQNSKKGLLVVNHEFTDATLMFSSYKPGKPTKEQVDIELAAQGVSVVKVMNHPKRGWEYDPTSPFNRRITSETEIEITGPAAGHPLLRVSYDATGTRVRGMLNNCAAGKTPWGTVLTCEENFNQYFANTDSLPSSDARKASHTRYGLPKAMSERAWELHHDRFNLDKEPNEAFRFGWVVEIDPYTPEFIPKKRTALGRLKHEAATTTLSQDGRVVVYTGDDERFEYMYKFVSNGKFNPNNRAANFNLLDDGTLFVARFKDDGTGQWIALIAGQGPLSSMSQAEILINTRFAADLVGATKMDRPEDIETNPANSKLYCVFTNNTRRGTSGNPPVDMANPRVNNKHGHIIELTENNNDAGATTFTWEIFMLCGDPTKPEDKVFSAGFDIKRISPISSPDNIVFDKSGNMWIATDGQPGTLNKNDGIYAVPVDGDDRGFLRQFLSAPIAAEICGPEFTPNNKTLFCSIQHPGEGGSLAVPISTWPDGTTPPRPSVITIEKTSNGSKVIGR